MAEYIDKSAVVAKIDEFVEINKAHGFPVDIFDMEMLKKRIEQIPAADVAPVRRGHWIEENGCQICSECGEEHEWDEYRAAYCDVCGAEMEVDNG